MKKLLTIFISILICFNTYGQPSFKDSLTIDSLKSVVNSNSHDTLRLKTLLEWDDLIYLSNPKLSFNLNNRIIVICKENLKKNIPSKEKLFYKIKLSSSFNNLGVFYTDLANYEQALLYYEKAIEINKKLENKWGLANDYNNVAWIYVNQSSFNKAREYYNKALELLQEFNDFKGIALVKKNIGNVYIEKGDYEKAMQYCQESLNLSNEHSLTPFVLEDIGRIYFETNNYTKALENYNFIANYYNNSGSLRDLSFVYQSVANLYRQKGNNKRAIEYFKQSINLKEAMNSFDGLDKCALNLYEIYKEEGDDNKALKYHELYMAIKDTLNFMSANEGVFRFEIEQEYALKKQSDSLTFENELIIEKNNTKSKTEKSMLVRNYLIGIIGLILFSLVVLFYQFNKTKSQKYVIERQHKLLSNSHKEIKDSINYAKKIQEALMTSSKYMKKVLPDSFVFFKPKDIVSGDFYWIHKNENQIFFTVADCTGHGVPGAFMSMIGTSLLNENIVENKIHDTAKILNNMRDQIVKSLNQEDNDSKDGMDLALCKLDLSDLTLQYSGAFNPLFHISKGELNLLKADNQPIALSHFEHVSFTSHSVELEKEDMIYIFSDGFADQFGGERGKKYMKGRFKNFLLSISEMPIEQQESLVELEFADWIGDNEQIDDVCVMGVRV